MVRSLSQWTKTLSFPSRLNSQKNTFCPIAPPNSDNRSFSDDPDRTLLLGSLVHCLHHTEGCSWTGELRRLKAHLNTCKFDAIPCTNKCGAQIPRVMMQDHIAFTCSERDVKCELCGLEICAGALEGHQEKCNNEAIYCGNKCGQKVPRRLLSQHKVTECNKRLVPCRYCSSEFVSDTLQVHVTKCGKFPMTCPNRCTSAVVYREHMDLHMKEKCTKALVPCTFKEAGCRFKGLRFAQQQHMTESTEQHLNLLCSLVSRQNIQIQGLKSSLENATINHSGVLIWRIPDFTTKMAEARVKESSEIMSTPFLTSQYGYKLQASLFLNGNGAGEGTHLSVYIKVLPGDFDPLLRWPFSHSVTFTLFDQTPEKPCNVVESFIPSATWENFVRPSNVPDQLGFGFPRFFSHQELMTRQYVKDDVLFLRVKAEPTKNVAV